MDNFELKIEQILKKEAGKEKEKGRIGKNKDK